MKHNLSISTKYLLTAVGSVLFVNAALPIIESISGFAQSAINAKISKMQMELEEANAEHQAAVELISPNDNGMAHAIGFSTTNNDKFEDEEED